MFSFCFLFPLLNVVFLETFDVCLFWSCLQIFYICIHMYMYITLVVIYKCFSFFLFLLLKVVFLETFAMCLFWSCWHICYICIHMYMYIIRLVIYKFLVLLTNMLYMYSYVYVYILNVVFLETFAMCLFWSCWQICYICIHMYMYIILFLFSLSWRLSS